MKVQSATLLSRDEFRKAVFARDNHQCVICKSPAQDAHHIMERRLFADGGYYLDNGASVCGECHMTCEETAYTTDFVRELAGINSIILPPQLDPEHTYDKWGNICEGDVIYPGELFYDESVQKVMAPMLKHLTVSRYSKYPRTPHLPWSTSTTKADIGTSVDQFIGREVVVTEKLDGENTNMYRDHIHARSIDSESHPSQSWVRNFHSQIAHDIPWNWRISGENVYARHAIEYKQLPSYFIGFGIFHSGTCIGFDDMLEWFSLLDIEPAPILYRGPWDESRVKECYTGWSKFGGVQEGYVVRNVESFHVRDFHRNVAKFVRPNHVQQNVHNWRMQEIVPNVLSNSNQN